MTGEVEQLYIRLYVGDETVRCDDLDVVYMNISPGCDVRVEGKEPLGQCGPTSVLRHSITQECEYRCPCIHRQCQFEITHVQSYLYQLNWKLCEVAVYMESAF